MTPCKNDALEIGDVRMFPMTHGLLVRIALLAGAMVINGHALAQPQPIPRPRELRQAPIITPEPVTPSIPSVDQERHAPLEAPVESAAEQPPLSRVEWRAIHRACGEEWSRMMKAGQTTGLIWIDFFETCRKRP
jgi:hypothetical protein